ncbi:ESCRT-III subunit protein did4 [Coemansia sp. RSA 990]|nr:Snf7-domain-containing protein [Coemansia mojavensis]KAJ1738387.1 ESCRT-III subunit protein did4 [Coemansia sp. RSA 1086]KAJ1746807.1 ESCRT-III subunit protein did4 [Coemansia sp. RSA 1821]KAJ1868175.1 ESCRT-III subunit protein did4 [Coemansia sp. RSA 990]KAJ2667629.1 ESCRT-III subunit protein did4 [Coemansia sp. RSA 1085]
MLDFLFGKRVTPQERMRQNKRALQKAQRQINTEIAGMQRQEKKLLQDIKKSAKDGQMNACKVMAKDLVRTRRYVKKYSGMKTSLQALEMRLQRLSTSQQMSSAVLDATKAMRSMNKGMNLPGIQKVLMDFEREAGVMDMKEEMIDDTMDEAMQDDEEDEEEETDEVMQRVLDEIGVQTSQLLNSVPSGFTASQHKEDALDDDAALQARLANLRKE